MRKSMKKANGSTRFSLQNDQFNRGYDDQMVEEGYEFNFN
jgi:hypothetical protein